MILQALTKYYETMLERGEISPPGWESAKVAFGLELAEDGTLLDVLPFQEPVTVGKKTVMRPRSVRVPARVKRSSGISANFLCDNAMYMLGMDNKGDLERAVKCFRANGELHKQLLDGVDTPAAKSILNFFQKWNPETEQNNTLFEPFLKELSTGANLVFCQNLRPICDIDSAICAVWQQHYSNSESTNMGQCLVTGRVEPIATLHPSIKGVRGAQSMGASLVSFNAPAFESYGHAQGTNAPVSEYAAFAYTTALNTLLSSRRNCRTVGDTTVVCWAEHGEPAYQEFSMEAMFRSNDEGLSDQDLSALLDKIVRGQPCDWKGVTLDPEEHFYFLGISPNAARLSVRFFLRDSFGEFMKNIDRHYQDIAIVRPSYDTDDKLPLWKLLSETVNQKSKNKDPLPQLAGDVLRAILNGTPYPATLLNGVTLRIKAEREVTRGRAAVIKAYYLRQKNTTIPKEVLQMELNEDCVNVAYTLGRMFSVYEQIQEAANPGINATIKDKYFNAAAATPSIIFPLLGNLAQKHLRVIRRSKPGFAVNFDKKLGQLSDVIGTAYPTRLTLPQQGAFQLGYYHENQARYQKKEQ